MNVGESVILKAVAAMLFFIINLFSIYLLLRGHNLPGGGFIGGLGSALSFVLMNLAFGVERARRILRVDPVRIAAAGLFVAIGSACLPLVTGGAFLTQSIVTVGGLSVGTTLVFDIGVFLVVVGVSTKLIFMLSRSISGFTAIAEDERIRYAAKVEVPVEDGLTSMESPEDET